MSRTLSLVLSIALLIGIQPVFAQNSEETVHAERQIIDLDLASDDEITQALETATELELVNKNDLDAQAANDAAPEESAQAAEPPTDTPAIAADAPITDTEPAVAATDAPPADTAIATDAPAADTEPAVAATDAPSTDTPVIATDAPAADTEPAVAATDASSADTAIAADAPATDTEPAVAATDAPPADTAEAASDTEIVIAIEYEESDDTEIVVVIEDAESGEVETVVVLEDGESGDVEIVVITEGEELGEAEAVAVAVTEDEESAEPETVAISEDEESAEAETVAVRAEIVVPHNIRNNQYFRESQRLAKLAEETYDYGDYDASANFAREAIQYALMSDVYVAIAIAKSRLDWAVSSGASRQYPSEYSEAEAWYNESLSARDAEEWENSIDAAHKVIDLLAYISAPDGTMPLPARYTVRAWVTFRDCLWNIAGRSWVYGDPRQWRLLYNANKSKLPDPDNPNLIEPGMVLDIPSLKGESRQGEWSGNRTYPSIP